MFDSALLSDKNKFIFITKQAATLRLVYMMGFQHNL